MSRSDEPLKQSADINAILKAIAQLSVDISKVSLDIAVVKNDVAEVKTDVAGLKTDVAGLKTDVAVLTTRVDSLERFVAVQFEAVQEGIAYNSAKFDRLEAKFYDARSDISNMRADVKELSALVRKKEFV